MGLPKDNQTYKRYKTKEKEAELYKENPYYNDFKETEEYYKNLGLDYNFRINTRSENYDEDKAMFTQESIMNVLGNKDLLHEITLYPYGYEYEVEVDENGKVRKNKVGNPIYLEDEEGNKIKSEPITMYQVWEKGDTGQGQFPDKEEYEKDYRGQCTYFVSKVLSEFISIEDYPELKNEKGYFVFDTPQSAKSLIQIAGRKDKNNKAIFNQSAFPSVGAVYADPRGTDGHVAIVTDVKINKDGNYTFTLLEQNEEIKKDGVAYLPPKRDSLKYGIDRIMPADYSMVIGERKVYMTEEELKKSGIVFITK